MPVRNAQIDTSVGIFILERLEAVRDRSYRLHADLYIHVQTLGTMVAVRMDRSTPTVTHG